jgi:hypothetical protein
VLTEHIERTERLHGEQYRREAWSVIAQPRYNAPVRFHVIQMGTGYRRAVYQEDGSFRWCEVHKFVVTCHPEYVSKVDGFFSWHGTFEAAVRAANLRARRYLKAYSKPRGLPVMPPTYGRWAGGYAQRSADARLR